MSKVNRGGFKRRDTENVVEWVPHVQDEPPKSIALVFLSLILIFYGVTFALVNDVKFFYLLVCVSLLCAFLVSAHVWIKNQFKKYL